MYRPASYSPGCSTRLAFTRAYSIRVSMRVRVYEYPPVHVSTEGMASPGQP